MNTMGQVFVRKFTPVFLFLNTLKGICKIINLHIIYVIYVANVMFYHLVYYCINPMLLLFPSTFINKMPLKPKSHLLFYHLNDGNLFICALDTKYMYLKKKLRIYILKPMQSEGIRENLASEFNLSAYGTGTGFSYMSQVNKL